MSPPIARFSARTRPADRRHLGAPDGRVRSSSATADRDRTVPRAAAVGSSMACGIMMRVRALPMLLVLSGSVVATSLALKGKPGSAAALLPVFVLLAGVNSPLIFPRSIGALEARRHSEADGRPVVFRRPGCVCCPRPRIRLGRGGREGGQRRLRDHARCRRGRPAPRQPRPRTGAGAARAFRVTGSGSRLPEVSPGPPPVREPCFRCARAGGNRRVRGRGSCRSPRCRMARGPRSGPMRPASCDAGRPSPLAVRRRDRPVRCCPWSPG